MRSESQNEDTAQETEAEVERWSEEEEKPEMLGVLPEPGAK